MGKDLHDKYKLIQDLFKEADGSVAYYRLTDIDGAKKIGKPNLSIVEGEQ